VNGRTTKNLTDMIAEEFGVGFRRAKTIVATEINHIQTQAAHQRYQDAGITEYEFFADTDTDTCDECGALDGKQFLLTEGIAGINMPPIHPNCRCCIVPAVNG
jgi:SPP1 gp7 family putative phage head morphogenesis protein